MTWSLHPFIEFFIYFSFLLSIYQTRAPVPLSLLTVFGSQPRSSRLQVLGPREEAAPRIEVSWSQSQSEARATILLKISKKYKCFEFGLWLQNWHVSRAVFCTDFFCNFSIHNHSLILWNTDPWFQVSHPEVVSVFSKEVAPPVTTVSSALQFSIVSTSTETSAPLFDATTRRAEDVMDVTDYPRNLHKDKQVLPEQSAARTSTKSTTISLPTTTPGAEAEDVRETTTDSDATRENLMTVSQHRDTTLKTLLQNESKSQEVTTPMAEVKSIRDDNQMMTTPIPRDLQLSESITSVYLHNSSSIPAVTNNIKTPLTKPKKDQVPNSISLLPFSKLTNQILDSSPSTVAPPRQEPVFTVTPVSTARASSSTMMTYSDLETSTVTETTEMTTMADLYSGQYYEVNPGQYHEINPGQYHEHNPGDYFQLFIPLLSVIVEHKIKTHLIILFLIDNILRFYRAYFKATITITLLFQASTMKSTPASMTRFSRGGTTRATREDTRTLRAPTPGTTRSMRSKWTLTTETSTRYTMYKPRRETSSSARSGRSMLTTVRRSR